MAILLGLGVAGAYGAGDFLGGLGTKRNPVLVVVAFSQVVGLLLLLLAVATVGRGEPAPGDLGLGAAGGLAGLVGLVLLYRGLATGSMSVVAPTTAVTSASVPVLWGVGTGERPSALALVGVAVALCAVALVAAEPGREPGREPGSGPVGPGEDGQAGTAARRGVALALAAGAAFGVNFVALSETGEASGLWPTAAGRAASLLAVWTALTLTGTRPALAARTGPVVAGAGALDAAANAMFVLGVREGLVSLVAVLSSLYPAVTVLLARFVLGERLARRQLVGLGLALAGVALLAGG